MKIILFTEVTIYTDNPTGGIRRFRELTEYLNKKEDIIVCSMDSSETMLQHGITHHYHLEPGEKKGLNKFLPPTDRVFRTNKDVISALKTEDYDKVIVFDIPHTVGLVRNGFHDVVLLIRKDLIGYERIVNRNNALLKNAKLVGQLLWENICFRKVKKVLTQCEYDKQVHIKRHPLISKQIDKKTLIQINNVNPSWIEEKSKEVNTESTLGEHNRYRVCFIGGFTDKRKGQDFFLELSNEIITVNEDIEFLMIGGGVHLDMYKKRFDHPQIKFLGRMDNPLSVLKQCDLLIVPSLADSCPNTVMEALYNDILVLGSKRGGIPEILVNEESLFDFDVKRVARRVIELKDDSNCRAALRKLQQKRKEELTFDWAERIASLI